MDQLVRAAQAALAEIATLKPEVEKLRAEVDRLSGLAHRFEGSIRVLQMLGASLDLGEVLAHFEREAQSLVAFDRLVLLLLSDTEPDSVRHIMANPAGTLDEECLPRESVRAMLVLNEWRPIKRLLWPGTFNAPDDARAFAAGVRSVLEVPLTLPDAPLGVASFGSFEEDAFSSADGVVLGALAVSLGQAVANCLAAEGMRQAALAGRSRAGQPGVTEGVTPDSVRAYLADHLHQADDWFNGVAQGLLLAGALDTYQVERLEDWWAESRE